MVDEEDDTFEARRGGRRKFDDGPNGMPWWVKAIGVVGVPSALAIYLVYTLVSWGNVVVAQANTGKELQAMLTQHVAAMAQMATDQASVKEQNVVIIRVLRSSCVNSAKSNEERDRCLR